ncbi:PKD domain-containing protein [cf. Phormidesmis sp. LEGE 11477]|uniref:PKD domain-containing protein n=1 Tax=cf. Phormidesmis sp. LEGE 11477 TaxID=1828680 RepID=UPI001882C373|nr:PKD domain-containing protein [cf. Phormidesmis sp. LEGE 11477]MBE9064736.1 PKD domain-containing protein [cf. Phormidesmis sp. LEGE 11477]
MTLSIVPVKSSVFIEEGTSISLSARTSSLDGQALTCEWNFGDGSASIQGATVRHRYHLAGSYALTLIVKDDQGTVSIVEKTAVVEMLPLAIAQLTSDIIDESRGIVAFEATATKEATNKQTVGDQGNYSHTASRLATYVWNFGDGSRPASGQKAIHKFSQSGNYYVSLIASSPSGATATQVHQVALDGVIQDSPIKNNKEVLKNYPITFNSPYKDNRIFKTHSIRWDFGDGTVVENKVAPRHIYRQAGKYTVSLEIIDERGNTSANRIPVEVVSAVPKILSLSANIASRSQDATEYTAIVSNPSKEALTYLWSFGDGSQKTYVEEADSKTDEARNVRHVYDRDGTYTATLEVTNETGERTLEAISIAVDSILQIESIAYSSNCVVGKVARFEATASSQQKDGAIYQWSFQGPFERSNGNTGQTASQSTDSHTHQKTGQAISFTFLEAGTWSVTLTVVGGSKAVTDTFSVFVAAAELAIAIQAKTNAIVGQSLEFVGCIDGFSDSSSSSKTNPHTIQTIEWDFGDGTRIESPTLETAHRFHKQGSYTVRLSVTDDRAATATTFVRVDVVELPLMLVVGGKIMLDALTGELSASGLYKAAKLPEGANRKLGKGSADRAEIGWSMHSMNNFYVYRGAALRAEGRALIAVPETFTKTAGPDTIDAIAPLEDSQRKDELRAPFQSETTQPTAISLVKADDSVQYQQEETVSVEVPQHHDLINNLLLQTSPVGYSPIQLDTKVYAEQIQTTLGWSEIFLVGESAERPTVIEIERGPLFIPGGVTLENMVIVVGRGDIVLREDYYTIDNLTLIAKAGGVELDDIDAMATRVFASKAIQTTERSHFQGNSLLASQQPIVFNGATVEADDCLKIVAQKGVYLNGSGTVRSQIIAKGDVELGQGTSLQGSIRTLGSVIFHDKASLSAAIRSPLAESHKTLTLPASALENPSNLENSDLAIALNIRLPNGISDTHHTIYVVELPPDSNGRVQLADGSQLFCGKQLTCAELEQTVFYPTSAATKSPSCFVYAIEDNWGTSANQTLSICFETTTAFASQLQFIAAQPRTLWPAMHQMVEVKVEGFEKLQSDFIVTLEAIVCSVPIGAKGEGGSEYDYEIIEDSRILLRAVRSDNGTERLYRLIYRIDDNQGNVAYSTLDIPVTLSADICVIEGS